MKYGLIIQNYGDKAIQMSGYNLGDGIQTYVVMELYKRMGICEHQIQKIELCHLPSYNGEYVVLPMLSMALGIGFAELPLSPKIIPVFISSHFAISELSNEQVNYLRNYTPIGCRDEYSLNTMRKYGIQAYLSGCITTTLSMPKEKDNDRSKIYCIDVPESLLTYIPEKLKKDIVYDTHLIDIPQKNMTLQEAFDLQKLSVQRLSLYRNTAKMVISSRLHALVPCIAMDIPVIGVFENISVRFSWLDKLIHLYTPEEFGNIDWEPQKVSYKEIQSKMEFLFSEQMKQAFSKYSLLYEVSDFFENRVKAQYGNHYLNLVNHIFPDKNTEFTYIIWGCGLIGNNIYDAMCNVYPNAQLKIAVDEYKTGTWHGVPILTPSELSNYNDSFVIIATYSGKERGYKVMKDLNRREGVDFWYAGTPNG